MNESPHTVLCPADQRAIHQIAIELATPRLSPERQQALLRALEEIAEKYDCDLRFTDN